VSPRRTDCFDQFGQRDLIELAAAVDALGALLVCSMEFGVERCCVGHRWVGPRAAVAGVLSASHECIGGELSVPLRTAV
jgi:hypothetical protein